VVELEVAIDDHGVPRCRRLEIRAEDGPVSGDLIRRIPLARVMRKAVTAAARKLEPPGEDEAVEAWVRELPASERLEFYEQYSKRGRSPQRGSPITDENLRQVADLYRAALERGDPPTQTVADAMYVARSTARWVAKARERGFLGASMRGRAGERQEGS
jgi:hypothetical protein